MFRRAEVPPAVAVFLFWLLSWGCCGVENWCCWCVGLLFEGGTWLIFLLNLRFPPVFLPLWLWFDSS